MGQELGQQAQPPVVPAAAGLAYVCRYLRDICEVLRPGSSDPGRQAPLEVRQVVEAVRAGADLSGPLEALHAALRRVGDPQGVWGSARALMPAGVDGDVPFERVYACPHGHCLGHSAETASAISYTCMLTREPLRGEAL